MEHKARISVTLDQDLRDRIDDAARAIGGTRSFTISTLVRMGLAASGGGEGNSSAPRRPAAAIVEIDADAHVHHVAVAATIEAAATLARDRGLRWAAGGTPSAVAALMPPPDASAAICTEIEHASIIATTPAWHRCPPQLTRTGHRS